MFELAYTSRASEMMTDSQLEQLHHKATQFNKQHHITGLLLYNDGIFFQLLEGEESTINTLFASIKKDFRHYDVRQIYAHPTHKRQFADWSMRFFNVSPGTNRSISYLLTQEQLDLTVDWSLPTTAKVLINAFQQM